MKVFIGKYKNWIGPYQIAKAICFWVPKKKDEFGYEEFPEWVDKFGDWLSSTWVKSFCNWIYDKNKRVEYVHIDYYDTWSMDHTLAIIILPMLKQLKEYKHGMPHVDDDDLPDNFKRYENDSFVEDIDDFNLRRWNWILDEIIWSFSEYVTDWESQFHSGTIDFKFEDHILQKGPNHTSEFDRDGYMNHLNRIKNGQRLFGKYYMNLWD